jgi:hypothetical protein
MGIFSSGEDLLMSPGWDMAVKSPGSTRAAKGKRKFHKK